MWWAALWLGLQAAGASGDPHEVGEGQMASDEAQMEPGTAEESREDLEDALLAEAVYGDLPRAARAYERIVGNRPIDDPSRAEALLALGRVRYELGQPHAARDALLEGIRTGSCLDPCQDLLGRIELEQESITELPVSWSFDDSNHGFFHPWQFDDKGTIRLERRGDDALLIWSTIIDIHKGDQLVVGFRDPDPPPSVLRFQVQARATDAWIQVVIVDDLGRNYALPTGAFRIPVNRSVQVEVDLAEVHPIDPLDPVLDPGRISLLQLRDVSAVEGAPQVPNTLYLDDFEVE